MVITMGRRERRKLFKNNPVMEREYVRLCAYFENLASTIFYWDGLPKGCRSSWVERKLYNDGQLCYLHSNYKKDQYEGALILPLAQGGQINAYGDLTSYYCISPIKTFKRTIDDAVLIRNNELRVPTFRLIEPLIFELADIRAAMQINRNNACKTPAMFRVTDKKQLSALNAYKELVGNEPIILIDDLSGGLPADYHFGRERAPYYGKELREEYERVVAEILTIMGIISNPVVKAERVNTIEAASNRGLVIDTIDSMLQCRRVDVDKINNMFKGTNLKCEINNSYTFDMVMQGLGGMIGADGQGSGANAT